MKNSLSLESHDNLIKLKKHTVIFTEGKPAKYLYLVKSGSVRLLKYKNSKLITVGLCKEKDILNEVAVLTKGNYQFAAIADTDAELVTIETKDITDFFQQSPKWIEGLFDTLCERLNSVQEVVEEHQMVNPQEDSTLKITKEQESLYSKLISDYLHSN